MTKFRLTKQAVKDLSNIWNYTYDHWSELQADKYYNEIVSAFHRISDNPGLGRNYSRVTTNLKGLKINKHIIFYQQEDSNFVNIIRILHERMDLREKFSDFS